MEKIAVVLLNLGGPDCKSAIKPFLFNFFTDPNIIRLPQPFRYFLAWFIASKRSRSGARKAYKHLGYKSPLLDNSRAQGWVLEKRLNEDNADRLYKSFVCMRYWHPMALQAAKDIREWGANRIVLLPLYPQYSTTTTRSSFEEWNDAVRKMGIDQIPVSAICCYPENNGFIKASAKNIIECYEQAQSDGHKKIRVLFSAHGLPEKVISDGDPYQYQCERSARRIMKVLKADLETREGACELDWQICYQSRVGPMKWIDPSIDEALEEAVKEECAVVVYPHAFTQEHVETLVELDIEYKGLAERLGVKGYYRAQTVGVHPDFIEGLAEMVMASERSETIHAEKHECVCPSHYSRCCMRGKNSSN